MNEQHRQTQLARMRAAIAECDRQHSAQEQVQAALALAFPVESIQADAFDGSAARLLHSHETSATVL